MSLQLEQYGFTKSSEIFGDFKHPDLPFEVKIEGAWLMMRDVNGDYASFCMALDNEVSYFINLYSQNKSFIKEILNKL